MQFIVPAIILLILSGLAIIYPPAILCACIVVASFSTPGVTQAFLTSTHVPLVALAGICLIAALRATYIAASVKRKTVASRRTLCICIVCVLVGLWMEISMYSGGSGLGHILTSGLFSGVLGVVFAVVYHRDRIAKTLFLTALATHLILAYGIVTHPIGPLGLLRPQLPGPDAAVWTTGTISKAAAQFDNPVPLAFFGAAGIIFGLFMLTFSRRTIARTAGLGFLLLGVWASYITVERAVWAGVFMGALTVLLPLISKPLGRMMYILLIMAAIGLLCIAVASDNNATVRSLVGHFAQLSDNSYRLLAAENSVDILVDWPLFGANGDVRRVVDVAGGAPHQSFYFFAVLYGIPAGIGVMMMTWWILASKLPRNTIPAGCGFTLQDRYLAHALGWVVLFLALSNNMSAGLLGWCCLGYACLPWIYSLRTSRRRKSMAKAREMLIAREPAPEVRR